MSRIAESMSTEALERELAALEQRLDDGERRIEEAIQAGTDATAWEAFWIELLHGYEAVYWRLHEGDTRSGRIAA